MDNINDVLYRLKTLFKVADDKEVAEIIGLTAANIYERKRRNSIPYEAIVNALRDTNANLEWIFYGIGDQNVEPKLKLGSEPPIGQISVRYFPDISASAGYGCLNGDHCEYDTVYIDSTLLPLATSKNIDAIRVHGDSMTPRINDGDTIFVDKSQRDIRNGKIFIIRLNEEIFVKRIYVSPHGLIIRSDNHDYPQFEIKKEEADILGQVIYTMEYHG